MTQEETAEIEQQSNDNDRRLAKRGYIIIGGFIALFVILAIVMNINDTPRDPAAEASKKPPAKRAIEHYRAEEYAEAIQAYDEAIRKASTDEDKSDLYIWRGHAKFKLEHYEAAVFDFGEVIHLQSELLSSTTSGWESANAHYWTGRANTEMEEYSVAIADFTTAIKEHPDADMYLWRGHAKLKEVRSSSYTGLKEAGYALAMVDLTEAIRREPDRAWAYQLRGVSKAWLGQREAAIYDFSEAIQLNGDYAWAYYTRGENNKKLGRSDDAKKDFDKAMELAEEKGNTDLQNNIRRARQ